MRGKAAEFLEKNTGAYYISVGTNFINKTRKAQIIRKNKLKYLKLKIFHMTKDNVNVYWNFLVQSITKKTTIKVYNCPIKIIPLDIKKKVTLII